MILVMKGTRRNNVKFKVILNLPKSRKYPLFILNSNFNILVEFEKGQNMKVVDLLFLRNFCIWSFSSSLEIFGEKEERRG
jgi:hypothetical protein